MGGNEWEDIKNENPKGALQDLSPQFEKRIIGETGR
jgi:hypothetical protein